MHALMRRISNDVPNTEEATYLAGIYTFTYYFYIQARPQQLAA